MTWAVGGYLMMNALRAGVAADVAALLQDVRSPPLETLGAMPIDEYLPRRERTSLATALNTLLASPTFEAWRSGAPLDVAGWLAPRPDGRTSAVIVSVAHLDDNERALVLGVVLDQFLAWMRTQPGAQQLRALLVLDEVFGFVPPHPANPPTKRPIVSLMKQARAFGVGVLLGAVQRRGLVDRPAADGRGPRAGGGGGGERRGHRGDRAVGAGRGDQEAGSAVVRDEKPAPQREPGAAAVTHDALLAARAHDP